MYVQVLVEVHAMPQEGASEIFPQHHKLMLNALMKWSKLFPLLSEIK
jgi:hypothetical protein